MSLRREFLGWNKPFLHLAASFLVDLAKKESGKSHSLKVLDLSSRIVVLPGARASRRLLTLLTIESEKHGALLLPPTLVTVGGLPEILIAPEFKSAADAPRLLTPLQATWYLASILSSLPPEEMAVVMPKPPSGGQIAWFGLAAEFQSLFSSVAAGDLSCEDVAAKLDEQGGFSDAERWEVLARIYSAYQENLLEQGVTDLHLMRREALESGQLQSKEIFLCATPDLSPLACRFLTESQSSVTALINAPSELVTGFDDFGCVHNEFWSSYDLDLEESIIHRARDPRHQAALLPRLLAPLSSNYAPQDISIGVLEPAVAPAVREELIKFSTEVRDAGGVSLGLSKPILLLRAYKDFLVSETFKDFATFVRHPDLEEYMAAHGLSRDYLPALDKLHARQVPELLAACETQSPVKEIQAQLTPLFSVAEMEKLEVFAAKVVSSLAAIFNADNLSNDILSERSTLSALETISQISSELLECPGAGLLSHAEFLSLVLSTASGASVEPPYNTGAIELLGWLELHLDDNPVLIVTSANEGYLPEAVNADQWLPNNTRKILSLTDNARRYARDAAALAAIKNSRQHFQLIVGALGERDEPLLPSRLLFTGSLAKHQSRIARLYGELEVEHPEDMQAADLLPRHFPSKPRKTGMLPIPSIAVTAFGHYLACPYRFYLRHVLKRVAVDDQLGELSSLHIGTLVHAVLQHFADAGSPVRESTDSAFIEDFLLKALDAEAVLMLGSPISKVITLQLEQIRYRLKNFARWQAAHTQEGWRIHAAELAFGPETLSFPTTRGALGVKGRIDRIDRNVTTGEFLVIDYKVGENLTSPDRYRTRAGIWKDVQLPLYAAVLKNLNISDSPKLALLSLHDTEEMKLSVAKWEEDDLIDALAIAGQVAEDIAQEKFWPPKDLPGNYQDDFEWICGELPAEVAALRGGA